MRRSVIGGDLKLVVHRAATRAVDIPGQHRNSDCGQTAKALKFGIKGCGGGVRQRKSRLLFVLPTFKQRQTSPSPKRSIGRELRLTLNS